jgi:hypothetical protein
LTVAGSFQPASALNLGLTSWLIRSLTTFAPERLAIASASAAEALIASAFSCGNEIATLAEDDAFATADAALNEALLGAISM